ncbi:MAG: Ig-like domain-containing protein, partial [Clostridia bacterium]|nr:Ig-like domain-containing protein [Clostridia bacterium]
EWDTTKAKAGAFKITASTASVTYGATKTLKVINTIATPTWTSSDTAIATVSAKGVVTGKGLGSAVITAKVGKKTSKCTVKVVDVNAAASVSFKSSNGGVFVKGTAATVTVKPKAKCAKAVVTIINASGTKVYSKSFAKLAKDNAYTFAWNGKKSDGSYVPTGSYRVKVVIGTKASYSAYLKFEQVNPFAGGNGAKSNPFLINTVAQFRKIGKYPTASFKQTANLDFGYTAVSTMFSDDNPYSGTYDGNGKTISNITNTAPIFRSIGKNGVLKNAKFKNCVATTNSMSAISVIAYYNYGKISDCTFNCSAAISHNGDIGGGIITFNNYGVISGCELNGTVTVTSNGYATLASGYTRYNAPGAKIISCVSHVDLICTNNSSTWSRSGGIASDNDGTIIDCEADGTFSGKNIGGIAGYNKGNIQSSSYTGPTSVPLVYNNTGVIIQ